MKILILGSQHGNERLGVKLYEHIKKYRPELQEYITYKLANPQAFRQNVRYIQTDMNRSYGTQRPSYESLRATRVLQYIDAGDFDLVLDMHTTTCVQPPCIIVDAVRQENARFISASTIARIVEMRHPITQSSLNGARSMVVSIEANERITRSLLDGLCDDIERYSKDEGINIKRYVYPVTELVEKDTISGAAAAKLVNFQLSPFGFYPILVGENSYKQQTRYLGFKAYERHLFKV